MNIDIPVINKIAYSPTEKLICGNSDYIIVFKFDDEWDEYPVKTARFVFDDKYVDVVFEGNTCPCPVLSNVQVVAVGVYAGDLQTTTPALIGCKKSILCENGAPIDPPENVYNQIMALFNSGFAPKVSTAEVGQTIVVKSTDENGHPTEWEAVDIVSDPDNQLASLIETDMLPAVYNENNKILTDENGRIILRY